MKKALLVVLMFASQISSAYVSDYEVVAKTNQFMSSKCSNFNTANAMIEDSTDNKFYIVYQEGAAEVGVDERPPHDDSGKTVNDIVVLNYSCN